MVGIVAIQEVHFPKATDEERIVVGTSAIRLMQDDVGSSIHVNKANGFRSL